LKILIRYARGRFGSIKRGRPPGPKRDLLLVAEGEYWCPIFEYKEFNQILLL
jgi:hypothetical protein